MARTSKTPRTRFTVEVTERDIERAHQNDSYNCVVAQAIARTVPDATRIEVDSQTIRFTTQGERRIYLCPYAVQGYVIAFDAGDPVEPFSFQLRDPKRVARRVATPEGRAVERAKTKARRAAERMTSTKSTNVIQSSDDPVAAAKSAYVEAKAEHAGAKLHEPRKGRTAPPRVFKKKQRTYGHRLLRINQEKTPD